MNRQLTKEEIQKVSKQSYKWTKKKYKLKEDTLLVSSVSGFVFHDV